MPIYAQLDPDGRIHTLLRSGVTMPVSKTVVAIDHYDPAMVGGRIIEGKYVAEPEPEAETEASE